MKKKIKLNDLCFATDKISSKCGESKYIHWDRTGGFGEIVFFTDDCLPMADISYYKDSYKIAWMIEPPAIRKDTYNYINQNYNKFNLILSHQLDFLKSIPNGQYCPSLMSWIDPKEHGNYNKDRTISIVASDKKHTQGHALRHEIINSCRDQIDVYGSCTGKFLENKADALRSYKFSIIIENNKSNGYFTEKIIDTLLTHTIPVYWGDPLIANFFNPDGIVICNSPEDIKNAIQYINKDPEKAYEIGKPYLEENFEKAKKLTNMEDYIFEQILTPKGLV